MTDADKNRRVAEWLGMCWHEQVDSQTLECKKCGQGLLFPWQRNPDFSADPLALLRVMRERGDWIRFLQTSCKLYPTIEETADRILQLLLTPGALLDAVDEWIKKRREAAND